MDYNIYIKFISPIFSSFSFHVIVSISVRSVMYKYLQERNEIDFDKIFNQKLGKCDRTTDAVWQASSSWLAVLLTRPCCCI